MIVTFRSRMKAETFQAARSIWVLVAQGGWWKPDEVFEQMDPDSDMTRREVVGRLWMMANRDNSLARRDGPDGPEYAITPECKPPRGVTVADVMKAVGATAA